MPSVTKAISRIEKFYSSLPRLLAEGGIFVLVLLLAWLDYATGRNIHLTLFYAAVCGFVAWVRGSRAASFMVVLCTVLTFLADRAFDPTVLLTLDLVNEASKFVLWGLVSAVMVSLRSRMGELDSAYEQIHRDVAAARSVQKAFLSCEIPTDPRFDLSVKFRTARILGGDYFQVRLVENELRVLVADVSGKGAPAALVTGLLSGLFSEISRRHRSPAKVLRILDQELAKTLPDGMFVTAFYLTLNLNTGEMTYAGAGHDPPFLCRPRNEVEELMPTGLPVGLLGDFGIEEAELLLKPEDLLVVYTDGLVNACLPCGERMGDEAFMEQLKKSGGKPAATITNELFAFTDNQAEIDDDVVVLSLRLTGARPSVPLDSRHTARSETVL